ncbi:MAG TPA: M24 family metallopeptidase, partial [Candidatus Saccharimonadales bacterium]|nr:M24 family metallopeptidase [Candidatus Saccharimonadales bacterium]
ARVGDISAAVEQRLQRDGLGVIEDLAGHGVGHAVHEEPWIPNFGRAGRGPVLRAGMTIAIEPMATLGGKAVVWGSDGWTISTADGSMGAHFEHTVMVTEGEAEILTGQ